MKKFQGHSFISTLNEGCSQLNDTFSVELAALLLKGDVSLTYVHFPTCTSGLLRVCLGLASNKQMEKKKSGAFLTTVRAKPKSLDELHSLYREMLGLRKR